MKSLGAKTVHLFDKKSGNSDQIGKENAEPITDLQNISTDNNVDSSEDSMRNGGKASKDKIDETNEETVFTMPDTFDDFVVDIRQIEKDKK